MTLMDRRRALISVQSGERILTGIVTVKTGNEITIPATINDNFIIINNSAEAETPMSTSEVVELFRINEITNHVYRTKNDIPTSTPPTMTIGAMPTNFVNQQTDTVTLSCSNENSSGIAIVGNEYRYFVW